MRAHEDHIPIFVPELPSPEKWNHYLEKSYKAKHFSNFGPAVLELEDRLAELFGVKVENISTCTNATLALMGAIQTCSERDEVWSLPSWTFAATACAIDSSGRRGHFLDVDSEMRSIEDKTFLNLIDVLPFGEGIDVERANSISAKNLIIDAAASFDAVSKSQLMKIRRKFAIVISFHPTKLPPGPEGAIFLSNDTEWVSRFRSWTVFGFNPQRQSVIQGINGKLNEFSASVILASLDLWHETASLWRQKMSEINTFCDSLGLKCHSSMSKGFISPYWIIESVPSRIKELENALIANNISFKHWWNEGCHKMKGFEHFSINESASTDYFARATIGLPLYQSMPNETKERIFKVLSETFA